MVAEDYGQATGSDEPYPPDPPEEEEVPRAIGQKARAKARAQGKVAGRIAPPSKPKKKGTKKRSQSRIMAMERERRCLELRKGGAGYDQIAAAVGYADASGARKAVERAMKRIPQEAALDMRALQIERCNHMLLTLWPQVQAGDQSAHRTALAVMQQLDAYTGAANAQQVDVSVTHQGGVLVIDGSKDDFINAMKRMAGVDANGHNVIPQGPAPQMPLPLAQGPSQVVQGVVVPADDGTPLSDSLTPEQQATLRSVMAPPDDAGNEPPPTPVSQRKGFDFSMDPDRFAKED